MESLNRTDMLMHINTGSVDTAENWDIDSVHNNWDFDKMCDEGTLVKVEWDSETDWWKETNG